MKGIFAQCPDSTSHSTCKWHYFFMPEQYSIVYMYHTFFIHSSVDKHLGCFRVFAVVDSAAVIIGVNASFKLQFSLPSDSPQKPQNTGMGSLCLLQGIFPIFPTLETNWGLLHCRWILYQLSHLGSPGMCLGVGKFNLQKQFILYPQTFTFFLNLPACSVAQQCPTLCGPMDCSLPGSSLYGISEARIME